MKLLIIGPFPSPINGCSLANQVLLRQLTTKSNKHVSVIDTNTTNISSQNVGSFSYKKVFSFIKFYKNIFYIKNYDIIYTTPGQTFFGITKYIPFYFFAWLISKPYIIHIHGNHLGNEYKSLTGISRYLFSFFIKKADAGIVLSKLLRPNFNKLLEGDKVFEVPNFAEDQLISFSKIEKSHDKLRLLYLSNLMEEKGILDFIACLEILKSNNIPFNANIAGKIEDELKVILSEKLEKLKNYVIYHGVVEGETKKILLLEANVFVMPTYYRMEGQPIALLEAMATGNIIVTTNFSGIPDIVTTKNGFFVEAKNPIGLANTLTEISNNLNQFVSEISFRNAEYVRENFTETVFANNVLKVINEVSRIKYL